MLPIPAYSTAWYLELLSLGVVSAPIGDKQKNKQTDK